MTLFYALLCLMYPRSVSPLVLRQAVLDCASETCYTPALEHKCSGCSGDPELECVPLARGARSRILIA